MARGGRIGSNLESITSRPELLIYSAAHAGPYITNYRYLYVVPNRPSCYRLGGHVRTSNMALKSLDFLLKTTRYAHIICTIRM